MKGLAAMNLSADCVHFVHIGGGWFQLLCAVKS